MSDTSKLPPSIPPPKLPPSILPPKLPPSILPPELPSFNPSVSFTEALKYPVKLNSGCHFYSFPLGVISIINFLVLLTIIFSACYVLLYEGVYKSVISANISYIVTSLLYSIIILAGGIILNLFMFYTQAYLIKGCQCSEQLSSVEQKPPPLVRQNASRNLKI